MGASTSEKIGDLLDGSNVELKDQAAIAATMIMKGFVLLALVPHEEKSARKQLPSLFTSHTEGA